MIEDQLDLRDFGGGTGETQPVLMPDKPVFMRFPEKGEVKVGQRGPVPTREDYGFVKFVVKDRHRLRAKNAYAFSSKLLQRLRALGCVRLLVAETNSGTVFEYHRRQFTDEVPKQYNPNHETDPQKYVPVSEARGVWPEHSDSVVRDLQF